MTDWKPEYLCVLDGGCNRGAHSLNCQEKNKEYSQAARSQERARRLKHMRAVIEGGQP